MTPISDSLFAKEFKSDYLKPELINLLGYARKAMNTNGRKA
jgi:hypothetical protein